MKKQRYTRASLKKRIDEYISGEGAKSLAGLLIFLEIDKAEFANWQADSKMGFSDIAVYASTCIERDVVENGLRGKYNATMASFILKTSFGYRDKGSDEPSGPLKVEIDDELRQYMS